MNWAKTIEIKTNLFRLGIKNVDIAKAISVTPEAVHQVIYGKMTSRRIMSYIENIIKQNAAKCPADVLSAGQLRGTRKSLRDKSKNVTVKAG